MATTPTDTDARRDAQALIDLIKSRFVTGEGFLARSYPPSDRTLFDNFDDIVPFFIYFGETDFLLAQTHLLAEHGENMFSVCASDGALVTRGVDEWFGGLYALWRESDDATTRRLLADSVRFIQQHTMQDGSLSAAIYADGRTAPYYESWSAGLLETACEMRDLFPAFFDDAKAVMKSWISHPYFERYALFPYRVHTPRFVDFMQRTLLSGKLPVKSYTKPAVRRSLPSINHLKQLALVYGSNGYYSQMMKSNSTCAFALLEFYRATEDAVWLDALLTWTDAALDRMCDHGRVFMEVVPRSGLKRDPGVAPAFIFVDALCDTVAFAGTARADRRERYLEGAREILDHVWGTRLENGLIPMNENSTQAHIDNQIDFAVSLRRYAELSGEDIYCKRATELTRGALRIHGSPEGFITMSGKGAPSSIDPKYNALVLKGYINLLTMSDSIYPEHHALFKDR